jgi:pimeloyl-ACP methyl ester carboxylesterase
MASRELISVVRGGICLRGTYHKALEDNRGSLTGPNPNQPVGVLFPNGGVTPRAGSADAAVFWADWFAKRGYPAFRFDLPGLGDSDRDPGAEGIDFQAHADAGGYGPWLSVIADCLIEQFDLCGVVVLAHCSGAVTAIFAADSNPNIRGLVLLDPYFHLQNDIEIQTLVKNWNQRVIQGFGRGWLQNPKIRAGGVKLLSEIRRVYRLINGMRLFVRRKKLPQSANLPLIRSCLRLASNGIPMLILRSPTHTPKAGEFDYIHYFQKHSARHSQIVLRPVASATHAFAEQGSKEPVAQHAEEWLGACFPLAESKGLQEPQRALARVVRAIGD